MVLKNTTILKLILCCEKLILLTMEISCPLTCDLFCLCCRAVGKIPNPVC